MRVRVNYFYGPTRTHVVTNVFYYLEDQPSHMDGFLEMLMVVPVEIIVFLTTESTDVF